MPTHCRSTTETKNTFFTRARNRVKIKGALSNLNLKFLAEEHGHGGWQLAPRSKSGRPPKAESWKQNQRQQIEATTCVTWTLKRKDDNDQKNPLVNGKGDQFPKSCPQHSYMWPIRPGIGHKRSKLHFQWLPKVAPRYHHPNYIPPKVALPHPKKYGKQTKWDQSDPGSVTKSASKISNDWQK